MGVKRGKEVEITVRDYSSKVLTNATVTLKPLGERSGRTFGVKSNRKQLIMHLMQSNPEPTRSAGRQRV